MVADASLKFDAVFFNENRWYEIDAVKDLHQAELMFPRVPSIGLPESIGFGHVASRSPSISVITDSDNAVTISKVILEKTL